jgi:ferrous iron transport protein B
MRSESQKMRRMRILLIGQPNVGKSSLLNAIAGSRVTVSNYPGTTVEIINAKKRIGDIEIEIVDTPGIYSISDRSEEEKITEKALFEEKIDGAIIIADAMALERSLYIVLQIIEAEIPLIMAVNFVEDAEKKGVKIDYKQLEKILNVPVVPINPLSRKGINNLLDKTLDIKLITKQNFRSEYDDHIEKAISKISDLVEAKLPNRFVSLRILEGDEDFYKYLKYKEIIKEINKDLGKYHPRTAEDISITRYGTAAFIAEKATNLISQKKEKIFEEKIDQILFHRIIGPFITVLFLFFIFGILLYLGNLTQEILMNFTENFISSFKIMEESIIGIVLKQGLTGLAAGISIALPYIFLFYLFLGLLEDTGILSRFIVNAERFLKRIGLPGKAFIPLILGLGCTAPATRATRILSSKTEQFKTATLFAFIPCSSRIAIIMGIVGYYGGSLLAFAVFITLMSAGLIWAFGIKAIFQIKTEPLILELPSYRKPLAKNVFVKGWIRMKDFVYIVIPLLVLGGITYGILEILNVTGIIVEPLSPITRWLGLPPVTIIPLVFGFLQKDLTGAMLVSVLGNKIALVLTPIQIYTFGVASTIGIPCIIALGILVREFGFKKSIGLTIFSIIFSFLLAGFIWRIIILF